MITLDIHLPDMEGWRILDRLKSDLVTRHIPICVVSTDDARDRALQSGAIGFLAKPLQSADVVDAAIAAAGALCRPAGRTLLVVMPDTPLRSRSWSSRLRQRRATSRSPSDADRGARALADADCVVVDDSVTDFGPEDLIEAMAERAGICQLPIVVYRDGAGRATRGQLAAAAPRFASARRHSPETTLAHGRSCCIAARRRCRTASASGRGRCIDATERCTARRR